MPQVIKDDLPVAVKPFTFFGIDVTYEESKDESVATCPFCDREGKLFINNKTGQWQCKTCGEDGNVYSFLRRTWEQADWIDKEAEELAQDRGLFVSTLNKWELRIHDLTEDWIVEGCNSEGKLCNLYRRLWNHLEKRWYFNGPKGMQHGLLGMHLWQQQKDDAFVCYSQDTEILTERGWVLFNELLETDRVASYAKNGQISFEVPKARQVFDYTGDMIHFQSRWCDLLVTPEHRVLWKRPKQRMAVSQARDVGKYIQLPTTGLLTGQSSSDEPTSGQIKLLVAFVADGCIRRGYDLEFVFSKKRKIDRLEQLLIQENVPFRKTNYPSSPDKTSFLIDRRKAEFFLHYCPDKTWTEGVLQWSLPARSDLIEELQYWDGDTGAGDSFRLFTSKKNEVEIISRLAMITGYSCNVETKRNETEFVVNLSHKPWRMINEKPARVPYQGKVYCVTVSTGFVVVRRNGKCVVSGNCEGLWDAMHLWELLTTTKMEEADYLPTTNPELALYSNANVIAVPSASVFNEYWIPLFAGKRVYLCYDNDHPVSSKATKGSTATKITGGCAGLEGMKRVANLLLTSADPPKEVHYLKWGNGESKSGIAGYNPELKHGYDLRDLLSSATSDQAERRRALSSLFAMLEPVSPTWVEGAKGSKGKPIIGTLECRTYDAALTACRVALNMIPQMERGLANMLAVSALVEIGGDQLWMKFIGPPSCGKTTLAEGLILARKYACMKSITTGLHSGYREKEDDGDYSLMNFIKDMAVIVKDGDTLLQSENLNRILSELRDAYDRSSSTHFRNKVMREYINHSFALLLFGTEAIRILDQSELGQRFIDCVVMDKIPAGHETQTNLKIAHRLYNIWGTQVSSNGDGTDGKEMLTAKQMIGGFLEHLRREAKSLVSEIRPPLLYEERFDQIAQFVAMFRARPSTMQTEKFTIELSHRLMQQFLKLGLGLCMVLGKREFDDEILYRVACCGLDTARGDTLRIARCLYDSVKRMRVTEGRGKKRKTRIVTTEGLDMTTLSQKANMETRELKKLLIFMRGIGAVETDVKKNKVGIGSRLLKWCLTGQGKKLYHSVTVMGDVK